MKDRRTNTNRRLFVCDPAFVASCLILVSVWSRPWPPRFSKKKPGTCLLLLFLFTFYVAQECAHGADGDKEKVISTIAAKVNPWLQQVLLGYAGGLWRPESERIFAWCNYVTAGVLTAGKIEFTVNTITGLAHAHPRQFVGIVMLPNRSGDLRLPVKCLEWTWIVLLDLINLCALYFYLTCCFICVLLIVPQQLLEGMKRRNERMMMRVMEMQGLCRMWWWVMWVTRKMMTRRLIRQKQFCTSSCTSSRAISWRQSETCECLGILCSINTLALHFFKLILFGNLKKPKMKQITQLAGL